MIKTFTHMGNAVIDFAAKVTDSQNEWGVIDGKFYAEIEKEIDGYIFHLQVCPKEKWDFEHQPVGAGEEPAKPEAQKRNRYTSVNLGRYFIDSHLRIRQFPYTKKKQLTVAEYSQLKVLLEEYGEEEAEKIVRYFLYYFKELPGYTGAPTVSGMVGFRKGIAHMIHEKENKEQSAKQDGGVSL